MFFFWEENRLPHSSPFHLGKTMMTKWMEWGSLLFETTRGMVASALYFEHSNVWSRERRSGH